jgi:hypothetical protein
MSPRFYAAAVRWARWNLSVVAFRTMRGIPPPEELRRALLSASGVPEDAAGVGGELLFDQLRELGRLALNADNVGDVDPNAPLAGLPVGSGLGVLDRAALNEHRVVGVGFGRGGQVEAVAALEAFGGQLE